MDTSSSNDYKNTYQRNIFVNDNRFRMNPVARPIPAMSFGQAKDFLPKPSWEGHDGYIEMYWKAWELAFSHIHEPGQGNAFSYPYIDTAYNGNLFMWDSVFITQFTKYGQRCFPFEDTLNNFYRLQHPDGFICREITPTGKDAFQRYDPVSTGPDIFSWGEREFYDSFGDLKRLDAIYPVLCAFHLWLKNNRTWKDGSYWTSGWGSGMDTLPRVSSAYHPNFSHGHLSWIDACLQQYIDARNLLDFGFVLERWQEIEAIEEEVQTLKAFIQNTMWNEERGFLFDVDAAGKAIDCMHLGSYWVLHTDILDKAQLERMVDKLKTGEFFTERPIPSLQKDHPRFRKNGRYWQGGVWASMNYMIISGLQKQGYHELAHDIAVKHLEEVMRVYEKTGTFWEYYSPCADEPGVFARPEFIGWTGLSPIANLIESIFGIRGNWVERTIDVYLNLLGSFSLKDYPFGKEGTISFVFDKKESGFLIKLDTDIPFLIRIHHAGKVEEIPVELGKKEISV